MDESPAPPLSYVCDCCGACCRGVPIVEIDHLDVLREPRLLAVAELYKNVDGSYEYESDWEKAYLLAMNRPCPFLGADNRCGIYSTRPNCCVAMEPGDEQCQAARQGAGLPPLVPSIRGAPTGPV